MPLRLGFFTVLVGIYFAGMALTAQHAPTWTIAALMGVVFIALVAAMYLRVLPAVLALPVLAISLAAIAGMQWKPILTNVVEGGGMRLSGAILAAIFGSVLAQVVEKTGIAHTAIKKTAELGGDRPMVLAVVLTLVIAALFSTLGGLGAVIMVATIVIPIMLSLGLRPLFVGCLFLLAMSLGGAFNLANWALYKTTLGMTNAQIGAFAWPFAGLMLLTTFIFLAIEGKRMGKARFKAVVDDSGAKHDFVPWYALLTPIIPLIPVLIFTLIPKFTTKPAEFTFTNTLKNQVFVYQAPKDSSTSLAMMRLKTINAGATIPLSVGSYTVQRNTISSIASANGTSVEVKGDPWTKTDYAVNYDSATASMKVSPTVTPTSYDFPISVALILGILYGAITTWKKGQSTVQLLTKSAFDGVAAVGPALVLMLGIGMVLIATMSPEVSAVIQPILQQVVPHGHSLGAMVAYVALFTVLAPLALYRGPLNLWGMGAGLIGVLNGIMPGGAIMGSFMAVGMIQGVSDPTNTHNVWIANYTNIDVHDILKRTLPYMWALAFIGLILSAVLYYR